MELDKIELLIQKYFEGETTLAEEDVLQRYFSSTVVAPHLQQYQPLFAYFISEKKQNYKSEMQLQNRKKPFAWISIAATIVLLLSIGIYTFNNYREKTDQPLGTYDDPEVAFRETQKALVLLSNNVNVGIQTVHYVKNYESTKNKIFITQ